MRRPSRAALVEALASLAAVVAATADGLDHRWEREAAAVIADGKDRHPAEEMLVAHLRAQAAAARGLVARERAP